MVVKSLLSVLFLFSAFSLAQTQYVVRKGDTLLKIADRSLGNTNGSDPRRYEIVKKIRSLNPNLKNPNSLEPGDTLTLPSEAKAAAPVEIKPMAAEKVAAPLPPPQSLAPQATVPPEPPAPPIQNAQLPDKVATPAAVETSNHPELSGAKPPAEPPAPAPVVPPSHEEAHSNFIFIQPRYQTLEIKTKELATETKATMKAQSSMGLDVQYGVILNHRFHLLFQAGVTQTQFKDIESETAGTTVNHKSETLKSLAVGFGYEPTSKLHLDFMLMTAERTFLIPATLPGYELQAVMLPGAELNISWDLYSGTSNIFGISAIGEYVGGLKKDTVEYKSHVEPLGALYWKSNLGPKRVNYKVTLTYKNGHQETSVTEQKEDVGILGLGFYF